MEAAHERDDAGGHDGPGGVQRERHARQQRRVRLEAVRAVEDRAGFGVDLAAGAEEGRVQAERGGEGGGQLVAGWCVDGVVVR